MRTTVVIIGAGHAGLAMSRRLTDRSIDHVVIERGEVANSWRKDRWTSLRLQTPNWQTCLPGGVASITAMDYRTPDQLDEGGVLVVGGSATGVQLADEICRSGRRVTLALGEHVRLPRLYRGRDIFWWMDAVGVLDERYDEV